MTTLAQYDLDPNQLDLLAAIEDSTATSADFKAACIAVASPDGWVNPNRVSAYMHDRFAAMKPQWFSAQWAPACGPSGFMDKDDREVPIDPKHSRGNGNKGVKWRRLRAGIR